MTRTRIHPMLAVSCAGISQYRHIHSLAISVSPKHGLMTVSVSYADAEEDNMQNSAVGIRSFPSAKKAQAQRDGKYLAPRKRHASIGSGDLHLRGWQRYHCLRPPNNLRR